MLDRRTFVASLFGSIVATLSGACRKVWPEAPKPGPIAGSEIDAMHRRLIARAVMFESPEPSDALVRLILRQSGPARYPARPVD